MRAGLSKVQGRPVFVLTAMALALAGCGGGGGNVRPTPAPAPAPPPVSPPATHTAQPPIDAQLTITHANDAHAQGFTGADITIGIIDSGIMRNHPALVGRVTQELVYVDPDKNNTKVDAVLDHGTWVSEIAAGKSFEDFAGGIAPSAKLVSARIISDEEPKDDGSGQGNKVTADDAQFFAQTLNPAMVTAGVQVMNNSWGGIYWDTNDASINKAFASAYEPFVLQHGGVVVFAAGNDSRNDPSDIAALPSLDPKLQPGWLVAVAVDSLHPDQLASYSNACGKAMNYCLAAPGDVIVSGKDDTTTNQSYYIVQGTSFAAPEVSGAAALVWQAFPYFSNDLVRQTLLGTADDLGAAGVDPVFGYGELNVGRAVNGPAKFDWGDVTVDFTGLSTWNNVISGSGGLIQKGGGRLVITQRTAYTGTTQVINGSLIAAGLRGSLTIEQNSGVLDTHSIGGNVSNGGDLMVNAGDVNVDGNYTQASSGWLSVELGSVLRVAGKATLAASDVSSPGPVLEVIGAANGYVANSHTDVLVAQGGLSGTFNTVALGAGVMLDATLDYDATSAWLNVTQVKASAVPAMSYTAASTAAAQRVDGAFGQINTQLATGNPSGSATPVAAGFVQGAANLQQTRTLASLQQSLESLSGQLHAASAAMTFEAIDACTRALSDRFEQLLDSPRAGGWTQTLGYHGDMSRNGYGNVGVDLNGMMVGADHRIGGNGFAGYAMNQSQGLGRLAESADQGRSHALEGMFYGGTIRGNWYTMGRFGLGSYREEMHRQIQLGSQYAGVSSDTSGRYGVAYGESGYRLALGQAHFTPYVNLQYAQIQRNGFNEQGGYGFGLKSSAQQTERWQAGLGLRSMQQWLLKKGGSLSLQMRVAWQQSFGMHGDVFEASFSGINQFAPVGGIGLSRYGGVAGTTLAWGFTPRASLQLGYERYFGQHQQGQMGSMSFNWTF